MLPLTQRDGRALCLRLAALPALRVSPTTLQSLSPDKSVRVSAASSVCVLGSGLLPSRERDRTLEAPLHCDPSPAASVRRARLSLFLLLRRQGTGGHCSSSSRYAGLRLACARSGLAAHCPLPSHQNAAAAASAAADAVVAAQTAADSGALAAAFAVTLSAAFDADPNGAGANSATQVRGAKAWSVVASPCPASACLAASALPQSYAAALARDGVSVGVSNMTTSRSGGSAAGSSVCASSGRGRRAAARPRWPRPPRRSLRRPRRPSRHRLRDDLRRDRGRRRFGVPGNARLPRRPRARASGRAGRQRVQPHRHRGGRRCALPNGVGVARGQAPPGRGRPGAGCPPPHAVGVPGRVVALI